MKQADRDKLIELGVLRERQRILKPLKQNYWHHTYFEPQEGYATKPLSELKTVHSENCFGCNVIDLVNGGNE